MRSRRRIASLVLGGLLAVSCAPAPRVAGRGASRVDTLLASMSLEEKAGQLVYPGANASFMNLESPEFRRLLHEVETLHVGGLIWFRSQVAETAWLTARLNASARIPLLVSADLESGTGMRFDDVTWGAWAMAVAATGDPSLAERRARATAEAARAIGVRQVFAPVADVNGNPDNPVINVRSFGEDPGDVSRFVVATVKGLEAGGVLSCLKHFPGHGDTSVDSHRALPVLRVDRARLEAVELPPFRAGLAAGASGVMVAHLGVPALDPEPAPPVAVPATAREESRANVYAVDAKEVETAGTVPATLSAPIVSGLLRRDLAFDGLVVTDAMDMGALTAHYETGEAAVRAVLAGNDQVLKPADAGRAVAAIADAARSGRLPLARLDASVRRVLAAKERLGLFARPVADPVGAAFAGAGTPAHEAVEVEIARRSLTLVKEAPGALPLSPDAPLLHVVVADDATSIGPAGALSAALGRIRTKPVRTVRLDTRSTPADAEAAVAATKDAGAVLLSLFVRARSGAGRIAVPEAGKIAIPALVGSGRPVVAVSFGSPYLLRDFPTLPTYLCAWGPQEVMQTAAADALFGRAPIGGRLPVTIPGVATRGTGLSRPALVR